MAFSQLRPLSFGEILDGAFTIYRRQFSSLFLTALLPQIPLILFMGVYAYTLLGVMDPIQGGVTPDPPVAGIIAMIVLLPLAFAGAMISAGAVTFQVSRAYTGSPVTTREALQRGVQRALAATGATILVSMMTGLGIILCVVPGIIAALASFAVIPAVVLERRGPVEAIERSWQLSKGAWGEVFLVVLVAAMIAGLPGGAIGAVATIAGLVVSKGDPQAAAGIQAGAQVLSALVRTLTIPFSLGCTVLLYYDRRVRTEALDVQMMAESLGAYPQPSPYGPPQPPHPGGGAWPETPAGPGWA